MDFWREFEKKRKKFECYATKLIKRKSYHVIEPDDLVMEAALKIYNSREIENWEAFDRIFYRVIKQLAMDRVGRSDKVRKYRDSVCIENSLKIAGFDFENDCIKRMDLELLWSRISIEHKKVFSALFFTGNAKDATKLTDCKTVTGYKARLYRAREYVNANYIRN